jgi:serine protease Do
MITRAITGVLLGLTATVVLAQDPSEIGTIDNRPNTTPATILATKPSPDVTTMQTSAATQLATTQPDQVDEKTVTGGGELFPDATPINVLQVTEKVFPAVVRIDVAQEVYEGGKKTTRRGIGSGTIFDEQGHILTNYHVAGRGVEFFVTLANKERIKAKLIGEDHWTDLAVIQLDAEEVAKKNVKFIHADFGTSNNLVPGQDVIAIGTPFGLSRTLTLGVVSNTERTFYPQKQDIDDYETGDFSNWIQMDTPIAQGNSGGPLVDLNAKIVGVNTRGMPGQSLNFAIPIDSAKPVVEAILASAVDGKKGRVTRGYLGIDFTPLQDLESFYEIDINRGALISTVDKKSPAALAGLKPQDILLEIDGQPTNIRFPEEIAVVKQRIASLELGKEIELKFRRAGQEQTVKAKIEKLESKVGEEREFKTWGMSVRDITRALALERRLDDDKGVIVTSVTPGFATAKAEINPGDVIRKINGEAIEDLDAFVVAYDAAEASGAKEILIDIQRGRGVQSKVLKVGEGK